MVNTIRIQRISYLFSKGWHFKYDRMHSCSLKPFHLPPPTYHKKEEVQLWTPGYLLEEDTHQQRNHRQEEQKKEGVEVTQTQPRIYLEIHLNSGEITHNKQLNKSKRKASKPCKHRRTSSNTTCSPSQQKTGGGGQTDPHITSWWEGLTKERPNNNQKPKTYMEPT